MFLEYFGMKEQPFGVTPDPRFLYLGKSHREALASLYYGVESDRGFIALIAPPGLGKTTLTFQLLEKLSQASRTVFLFQTQCNSKELFQYLLNGLGVDPDGMGLVSMHNKVNEILCREMLAGRRFVLAIDEAQNLEPEVLETIRLLSNFETSRDKMLNIILIGQPQLAQRLGKPELEQLRQRVSVLARLEPLDFEETVRYIAHRLNVAGYTGNPLFDGAALRIIARQSQGIPRKINALCFAALSLTCALGLKEADASIMEEVVADRDLESFERSKASRSVVAPAVALHPAQPSPMLSRPALSAYHAPQHSRSFARWAVGVTAVAACVVIGLGAFFLSPSRIDRSIQEYTEAWSSIRSVGISIRGLLPSKSDSAPLSSVMNVQAAELTNPVAGPSSLMSDDSEAVTVNVQPGETLKGIILRAVGEPSDGVIAQIQALNPSIADFDHLTAGQKIRLPRVSVPVSSASSNEKPPLGAEAAK